MLQTPIRRRLVWLLLQSFAIALAAVAILAIAIAFWANRGCRTFDSRDPIAPGVVPAATRLRTAMMKG